MALPLTSYELTALWPRHPARGNQLYLVPGPVFKALNGAAVHEHRPGLQIARQRLPGIVLALVDLGAPVPVNAQDALDMNNGASFTMDKVAQYEIGRG